MSNTTMRSGHWLVLLVLSTAGTGCSGSTSEPDSGSESQEECSEQFTGPVDPSALIDDLEDGDGLIAEVGTRNGGWWISTDESGGSITPPANMQPPAERILGGRCDSEYAMRVTGTDFTEWGAVLSLGFRYDGAELPIDISDFDGIMFWARVGDMNSSSVRIQFQDSTTHVEGGVCNAEPGSSDECWDGWGTEVAPIDTDWRLYKIRFDTLSQRNYGLQGDAFDLESVYNIDFNLDPNSVFDLWIDDLWFYSND